MKKVLVLGGTGAIGVPLVRQLAEKGFIVHVTSRKQHTSEDKIKYIQGNAHDLEFMSKLLKEAVYDVIVDLMIYSLPEFEERAEMLLKATKQYIFISSARVYAFSEGLLTEESPRLLETCSDKEYLATNEYAIRKAKEENILLGSSNKNWTIIRPSLTYNTERLQSPLDEKEGWLYRALHGLTVFFPSDLSDVMTTMTFGDDVSAAISKLVDNPKAMGEIVHIAGAAPVTWGEVYDIYLKALEKENIHPKVKYFDDSKTVSAVAGNIYQYKYARSISRVFDNSKLFSIIGEMEFTGAEEGLTKCVREFVKGKQTFGRIHARLFGYYDRLAKEKTPLKAFGSARDKLVYILYRRIKRG